MKTTFALTALVAAVSAVETHIAAYQQCGGNNWAGPGQKCVEGYHCKHYNRFYSQCVPNVAKSSSAEASAVASSTSCTTTLTISSSSSVAAPATTSVPMFGTIPLTYSTYTNPTGTGVATASEVEQSSSAAAGYGSITLTYATVPDASGTGVATASPVEESSSGAFPYGSIALTYSMANNPTGTGIATASEVPAASSTSVISPVEASSSVAASSGSIYKTTIAAATSSMAASTLSTAYKATSSIAVASSTAATSSAVATSTKAAATSASATGSYPTTSGTEFVIDGEAGYFAGTNSYWIGFLTNNDDVDLVMQHLASSGLKVLRVWGFNDVTTTPSAGTVYFQSFAGSEPTINTGADGLERLDYVVKSAEAHGIKLIINFVNNWTDYGGMAAYFTYAGITSNQEWYNSTKAQTQYQAYIEAVVSRYPSSSAIFAWELANEPRCNGCDSSVITTWVKETSAYIKGLDANRMVTIGEEGFGLTTGDDGTYPYTFAEGTDFAANCAVADIDFCTYHLYPESWSVTPTLDWGNAWIASHAKACVTAGKPCLLEEFGASNNCDTESAWQATALKTAGTGGDMFWQYGDTLSFGQTSQDGNTAYYGDSLYTCLVTNHVKAIDAA